MWSWDDNESMSRHPVSALILIKMILLTLNQVKWHQRAVSCICFDNVTSITKETCHTLQIIAPITTIWFIYKTYNVIAMGILKITDRLHDEIRKSSKAMSRSINAQAEFWIKIGRLCELHPTLTYQELLREHLLATDSIDSELSKSSE